MDLMPPAEAPVRQLADDRFILTAHWRGLSNLLCLQ